MNQRLRNTGGIQKDVFILLVTQATRKKNPSSPNRSRTYDLLVTSPDAIPQGTQA